MRLKWIRQAILTGLAFIASISFVFAQTPEQRKYNEDLRKYNECVAKVRRDYPVPPGNVNTQRQMIENDCGKPPVPPKK